MQIAPMKQPQNDEFFLNNYKQNANQILQNIKKQFLRSIKDVNDDFQHSGYSIAYYPLGKVYTPLGKEFENLPTFEVSITRSSKGSLSQKSCFLSLGTISPFVGDIGDLIDMANDGNISSFEEIYSYRYNFFKEAIELAKSKHSSILRRKIEMGQLFLKAVQEVNRFIAYNHFKPIVISQENHHSKQKTLEYTEDPFEPLMHYNIWKMEKIFFNNQIQNSPLLIGKIAMISETEFRKTIDMPEENLEEIYDKYVKEIKDVVIKTNKTQLQIARIFAATIYRDSWRITFIIFNRFKNVLKNFIIRENKPLA